MSLSFRHIVGQATAIALSVSLFVPSMSAQETAPPTTITAPKVKKARKPKDPNAPKVTRVPGIAYVRVLHGIMGGPNVDVYVDGGKKSENLSFGQMSEYATVNSGSRLIALKKTGTDEVVTSIKKTATKDKWYVLVAVPVAGKPGAIWQNEVTGKPNPAKASVRIYHLVPGAPAVAITAPAARGANKTRTVIKTLEFGKSRAAAFGAGTISLQVRAGEKLLKEAPATVEVGKRYGAFAIGSADDIKIVVAPVGK